MDKCKKCGKTLEISYPLKIYCKCITNAERLAIQVKRELNVKNSEVKTKLFFR